MIQKLRPNRILPLTRLSPSQYYSALNCAYKMVLANSFGYEPLLPMNANAYFGTIIHKMLELISKGKVIDEDSFTENWRDLISKKETELEGRGLSRIVPLKYFVTDFALKKNRLRSMVQTRKVKLDGYPKKSRSNYYPEERLTNAEKNISGVADLIIENDSTVIIIDFKIGKIYEEAIDENGNTELIIKKEYDFQLKLYAHLYFLMYHTYPTSLFLVTLENDFIEIPFTEAECENIYRGAMAFILNTNTFIKDNEFEMIANPSKDNCKYCSYRPGCSFYSVWLTTNFQLVNDLRGVLKSVTLFNNHSLGLRLGLGDNEVLINGLPSDLSEDFEKLVSKDITLYNVKKNRQSLNATASNFTIIYE